MRRIRERGERRTGQGREEQYNGEQYKGGYVGEDDLSQIFPASCLSFTLSFLSFSLSSRFLFSFSISSLSLCDSFIFFLFPTYLLSLPFFFSQFLYLNIFLSISSLSLSLSPAPPPPPLLSHLRQGEGSKTAHLLDNSISHSIEKRTGIPL